jgi:hypothetical protein
LFFALRRTWLFPLFRILLVAPGERRFPETVGLIFRGARRAYDLAVRLEQAVEAKLKGKTMAIVKPGKTA